MVRFLRIATGRFSGHITLLLILFFMSQWANAAAISSVPAGGNWSASATWVGGIVPGSADAVTIVSGSTVTVDIPTATCTSLNINTGVTGGGAAATLKFNTGSILTISGSVTIGASGGGRTGSINMTNGGTISAQQFIVTRAGTWTPGTGTVQLTAINNLPATFFTTFNNLDISASVTTTGRALTINGNLTVADGATFIIAGFAITVNGTTTVGNGASGTLNISSATGAKVFVGLITTNAGAVWNNSGNSAVTVRGGITNNGTFTSGAGVYTFNTNAQTLTGIFSIATVTVTGIVLTNSNTLTVATALTGSGTLTQSANAVLNIGGSATVTTLTATSLANTVNYTGTAQTIKNTNYYNLTLSGSGADVLPAAAVVIAGDLTLSGAVTTATRGALTVTGNLIIGDGNTFTAAGFALTISGTTTIGSGISGIMNVNSAVGTKTFVGLLRTNTGAVWNNSGNSPVTVEGGITHSGATFTSGTGVYTFSTNDQVLNQSAALTINNVAVTGITLTNTNTLTVSTSLSGTGTLLQSGTATLNIGGTSTITGLNAATNAGNTVNYTGAAQTINPTNYYNLTFSGTGVKTLLAGTTSIAGNFTLAGTARATVVVTGLTIGGNFVLGAGTRFTSGAFTHSIGGNWVNNGTTFTPGAGTINFNGTLTSQIIGGTTATTFNNLTINNTSAAGFVSLDDGTNTTNKIVTGLLTLTSGYLTTTASNLLVLNNGSSTSVANAVAGVPQFNSPYINGPMNKIGNQAFIFPIGSAGTGCVPIGISAPATATASFEAQYNRSSANALGPITSVNLFSVSFCEYWVLNRIVGASTVNVTAYWNQNSPCNGEAPGQYVTDLTTISLAHFNGTSWDNNSITANSFTTGGTISGGVTWTGVSTFSPFALGNNTSAKNNPLPITLYYFNATKANGYNELSWKAACTHSSNLFEAQRSYNGTDFETIDSVKVNAAADCEQGFIYRDYSASGSKIYYRIKSTDVDGNITYSYIVLITSQASIFDLISVYPNPVQGDAALKISSLQNDHVELLILSMDGRELQRRTAQVPIGTSIISLSTSGLPKGIYIVKGIFSGGQTSTIKIVKQ